MHFRKRNTVGRNIIWIWRSRSGCISFQRHICQSSVKWCQDPAPQFPWPRCWVGIGQLRCRSGPDCGAVDLRRQTFVTAAPARNRPASRSRSLSGDVRGWRGRDSTHNRTAGTVQRSLGATLGGEALATLGDLLLRNAGQLGDSNTPCLLVWGCPLVSGPPLAPIAVAMLLLHAHPICKKGCSAGNHWPQRFDQ